MPGPVPGIVNTKMAKTWSLTAEVQSHEEDMQTEGLVERREVCAGGSNMEEVALRLEKDSSSSPGRWTSAGKGRCWSVRSVWGSFVVGGDTGQRAGPGRRALNARL